MGMTRTAMPETSIHKHCHTFPTPDKIGRARKKRRTAPTRNTMSTEQPHHPLLRAGVSCASHQAHNCSTSLRRKNVGHARHIMLNLLCVESSIAVAWCDWASVIGLLANGEHSSYSASSRCRLKHIERTPPMWCNAALPSAPTGHCVSKPPLCSAELAGSILASNALGSTSPFNVKSTNSAEAYSSGTGRKSLTMKTSKNSAQQTFLSPMFGPEDSPAKTSRWRAWAREQGLEGSVLDSFMTLLASLEKHAPELYFSKTLQVFLAHTAEEISASSSGRWPSSGILSAGVCLTAKTSESPNHAKESTLSGVIEMSTVPDRYFLKPNAAKGMLRRANQMGRPLFPPLRKALEILAETDRSSSPLPTVFMPALPATPEPIGAEPTFSIRNGVKSGG